MENFYMNPCTGSVDTREGWIYTDETGLERDPVQEGEVIAVTQDKSGNWIEL
jgi:hypothetical protein